MLLKFYLIFFIIVFLIYRIKRKQILYNEIFWLVIWWSLVLSNALISKIHWGYDITPKAILFIVISFITFMLGRYVGFRTPKHKPMLTDENPTSYRIPILLGVLGALMFIVDFVRLNGLLSTKSSYDISIIGSIGMLLIPILLVMGLYRFAYCYYYNNRFDLLSMVLLVGYSVPGILNSGRESIMLTILAVFVVKVFCDVKRDENRKFKRQINLKKMLIFTVLGVLLVLVAGEIYTITLSRFTGNEIGIFLYRNTVPIEIQNEANSLGDFKYFYYTFLSYFGHQVSFISCLLDSYTGPYMFGMFELNIISRRLPSFLGLDFTLVSAAIRQLASGRFSGEWFTILGAFLVDFGKVSVPIVTMIVGYFEGKARKFFERDQSISSSIIIALICMSMMSSVQLGPFYSTSIYGTFIWWFLIFRKGIGKRSGNIE